MTASPRYAPAREDGTKPYVVTVTARKRGGAVLERLVYRRSSYAAAYAAMAGEDSADVLAVRRATLKEYR